MNKGNYSIVNRFNSDKGKIERKIEYEGQTSIQKNIELQIETSSSGYLVSFRVCLIDNEGRPDCGGFAPYGGNLMRY